MDNAAYFFTGVLAGVAGLTLLAVLDNKYGFITGTPTSANDDSKVLIIVRDSNHPATTDATDTKDEKTEKPETKPDDTDTAENDSVQPNTDLAVA